MHNESKNLLITGGAGFIGSHLVRLMVNKYPDWKIINVDALTYAGNLDNVIDVSNTKNYHFEKVNIVDYNSLSEIFHKYKITDIIHLAAESHVDRSIDSPMDFVNTNVIGTINLLNIAKSYWAGNFKKHLFYHVSTDEVYGSLGMKGFFKEDSPYDPNSPYSASKASSDHFVRSYGATYGLNYVISNCSNNYGPNQYPEKLFPVIISSVLKNKNIPIYGDGLYYRDWLFVSDHILAIDLIFNEGDKNETYNIGGHPDISNIELVELICSEIEKKLDLKPNSTLNLIKYVKDRPGHDKRYAIDCSKLKKHLKWKPKYNIKKGIEITVDW